MINQIKIIKIMIPRSKKIMMMTEKSQKYKIPRKYKIINNSKIKLVMMKNKKEKKKRKKIKKGQKFK